MFIEEIPLRINAKNLKYTDISKYYIKELNDSKKTNKYAKLLNTDILSLKDYNQWYHINGKYYYFKECFAFNELFMSELFKEFNLKCVNFEVVRSNKTFGVISENFRKKGYEYYNFFSYFYDIYPFSLDKIEKYTKDNNFINSLYRLLVVDFFSGQCDRYYGNLLIEEFNESFSLAPFTDNGDIFSLDYYTSSTPFCDINLKDDNIDLETKMLFENSEFIFYLKKCLDIDINKILDKTVDKYKLKILKIERKNIINYFDCKKSIIEKNLTLNIKK